MFKRTGIGQSWIDHIFLSYGLLNAIQQCSIIEEENLNVSDHLPVSVPLAINGITIRNGTCEEMNWSKASDEDIASKYTTVVNNRLSVLHDKIKSNFPKNNIENVIKEMCNVLALTANEALPKPGYHRNGKPFWHTGLSQMAKHKQTVYNEWVKVGKPRDPENEYFRRHKQAKQTFRKEFRQAKVRFHQGIEECIDKNAEPNQRQFWRILKAGKKGHSNLAVLRKLMCTKTTRSSSGKWPQSEVMRKN